MKVKGHEVGFVFLHWNLLKFWNWSFKYSPKAFTLTKTHKTKDIFVSGRGPTLEFFCFELTFFKPCHEGLETLKLGKVGLDQLLNNFKEAL